MRSSLAPCCFLFVLAGLIVLVGLPGCGIDDDPELDELIAEFARAEGDETIEADVLERIGRIGRKNPDTVVPQLIERLKTERSNPYIDVIEFRVDYSGSDLGKRERSEDLKGVVRTMNVRRLTHFPRQVCTFINRDVDGDGIGRVHVRVPRPVASEEIVQANLQNWIVRFTMPGTSALWIVVDPPQEGGEPRSLWPGDRASYDAFVAEHGKVLDALSGARGEALQSGDESYRLCLLRPATQGGPIRKIVLRKPRLRRETFDDRDLMFDAFGDKKKKRNVLTISIDEKRRESFRRWCEEYAGHQMALLVNEKAEFTAPVPPVVDGAVEDPLYLDMGALNDPASQAWVRALMESVQGTIRYPIEAEVLPDDPQILDTAYARMLVAVGKPALEPVQELRAAEGSLGRRAQWIIRSIMVAEARD